jgi:hypothetical protein
VLQIGGSIKNARHLLCTQHRRQLDSLLDVGDIFVEKRTPQRSDLEELQRGSIKLDAPRSDFFLIQQVKEECLHLFAAPADQGTGRNTLQNAPLVLLRHHPKRHG